MAQQESKWSSVTLGVFVAVVAGLILLAIQTKTEWFGNPVPVVKNNIELTPKRSPAPEAKAESPEQMVLGRWRGILDKEKLGLGYKENSTDELMMTMLLRSAVVEWEFYDDGTLETRGAGILEVIADIDGVQKWKCLGREGNVLTVMFGDKKNLLVFESPNRFVVWGAEKKDEMPMAFTRIREK